EVFTRHSQPPGCSANPAGQHDAARAIASNGRFNLKLPAFKLSNRFNTFAGTYQEPVFADNLVPAPDQVFLARAVQPELALGRPFVGLGVDPLSFRKIFDGIGDLVLFEN